MRTKHRRLWFLLFGGAGVIAAAVASITVIRQSSGARAPAGPAIEVYKDPGCRCCTRWVEHLRAHGFGVRVTDTRDLASVKASHRVPPRLQSCHTAIAGGYVIEGHVPASDLQRLLQERPEIAGVAVAGMPVGSPGMEMPGAKTEPYDVMAFDRNGAIRVFGSHR